MTLSELQQHVFNIDTLPDKETGYVLKLMEEVGELGQAIRKKQGGQPDLENLKGSIAEELVDVLYYTLALANLHGVDLHKSFQLKEQLNQVKYNR